MCLSQNAFDLLSGFVGVPISRTVFLKNLTLIPTQYTWEEIETEGDISLSTFLLLAYNPLDYSVKFEPGSAQIGPHENVKVVFTFTPHRIPEVADVEVLLCCDVVEMDLPIGCLIRAKVLFISY